MKSVKTLNCAFPRFFCVFQPFFCVFFGGVAAPLPGFDSSKLSSWLGTLGLVGLKDGSDLRLGRCPRTSLSIHRGVGSKGAG